MEGNRPVDRHHRWRTLLPASELEAALQVAYETIARIGIEVRDDALRHRVALQWGAERDRRLTFTRDEVDHYLASWRERNDLGSPGWTGEADCVPAETGPIHLSVMPYGHTYLDPESGRHLPLTTERLIEATRFLATLSGQNVHATVAGHPVDVPAELQPVLQYKIGAQHNPMGGGYGWLGSQRTAEHLMQMAQVMGQPIRSTVVYVFSPLRLGGMELETAIALKGRFETIHVGNMGSCGGSLPLFPKTALAVAWAESIAGAMCVEALTGVPANWSAGIEPFDPRAQTIPFGAPEQILWYRLNREAGAWFRGACPRGGGTPLLTMAKAPGAQAGTEKSMAASYAVSTGCTSLGAAGSLSADEVFSPAQALLDIELRNAAEALCASVDHPLDTPDNALEIIREGITRGSFAAADTTLDHYRDVYWLPEHARREMLAGWERIGRPSAIESARHEALDRIQAADWLLPEPEFTLLQDIYLAACRELGITPPPA